jgi:hypothetical protein
MLRLFLCGDVMTGRGIDQALALRSLEQLGAPFGTQTRLSDGP